MGCWMRQREFIGSDQSYLNENHRATLVERHFLAIPLWSPIWYLNPLRTKLEFFVGSNRHGLFSWSNVQLRSDNGSRRISRDIWRQCICSVSDKTVIRYSHSTINSSLSKSPKNISHPTWKSNVNHLCTWTYIWINKLKHIITTALIEWQLDYWCWWT